MSAAPSTPSPSKFGRLRASLSDSINRSRGGRDKSLDLSRNSADGLNRSRSGLNRSRSGMNRSRNGMNRSRNGTDESPGRITTKLTDNSDEEGKYANTYLSSGFEMSKCLSSLLHVYSLSFVYQFFSRKNSAVRIK
jgi:hypothetical protein